MPGKTELYKLAVGLMEIKPKRFIFEVTRRNNLLKENYKILYWFRTYWYVYRITIMWTSLHDVVDCSRCRRQHLYT